MILHHSTTICCGYQPVIHCGVLRQSADIIDIQGSDKRLKTGESEFSQPLTMQLVLTEDNDY
jgi:GTPase